MKVLRGLLAAVAALVILETAVLADKPVQLALWPPNLQLVGEEENIGGFRFNIYGRNQNVVGFDLGLGHETLEDFTGIEFGLISSVGGVMRGLQWNLCGANATGGLYGWQSGTLARTAAPSVGLQTAIVTWNESDFDGVQLTLIFNEVQKHISGFQAAVVNHADDIKGLQLGIANFAGNMNGLQIGLWNQIYSKDKLQVLPLVNWKF